MTVAPDLTEKVVGYRVFWPDEDGELRSFAVGYWWARGVNRARCLSYSMGAGPHPAPDPACGCGLYAYHDADDALRRYSEAPWLVCAAVTAWGRIEVHHEGFRAEYAEIVLFGEFFGRLAEQWQERREDLGLAAARYRVPAVPRDEFLARGPEFGSPIPRALRPPPLHRWTWRSE